MLEQLAFHPVILQGQVISTEAHATSGPGCTFCTLVAVRVHDYIKGTGPAVAHLAVRWINTREVATAIDGGKFLPVPSPGDSAIFWVGTQDTLALLYSTSQVWAIRGGRIPELNWSLAEARAAIAEADERQSLSARYRLAKHAVLGDDISWSECSSAGQPFFCFLVRVRQVVKGTGISDSLITVANDLAASSKRRPGRTGLYLLGETTPEGWYELIDTTDDYIPASQEGTVPAYYGLVAGGPIDGIRPTEMSVSELINEVRSRSK